MLSDKGSETIKRYGLLNTVVPELLGPNRDDPQVKAEIAKYISVAAPNPEWQGIAFPGTFKLAVRDASRHGFAKTSISSGTPFRIC